MLHFAYTELMKKLPLSSCRLHVENSRTSSIPAPAARRQTIRNATKLTLPATGQRSLSSAQGNVRRRTTSWYSDEDMAIGRHNAGAMTVENQGKSPQGAVAMERGVQTTDFRFLLISFSICLFLRSFSTSFPPTHPLRPKISIGPVCRPLANRGSKFYAGLPR